MEKSKLYFAYGMNTNHMEMTNRCPNAEFIGIAELEGYELKFRQVADVEESEGSVFGAVWKITRECEEALDILEGYPDFYGKIYRDVMFREFGAERGERSERVMLYKMNFESIPKSPSIYYWEMLVDGYRTSRLPVVQLNEALCGEW